MSWGGSWGNKQNDSWGGGGGGWEKKDSWAPGGKGGAKGGDSWGQKPAWGSSKGDDKGGKGWEKKDSWGSSNAKTDDSWGQKPAWGAPKADAKGGKGGQGEQKPAWGAAKGGADTGKGDTPKAAPALNKGAKGAPKAEPAISILQKGAKGAPKAEPPKIGGKGKEIPKAEPKVMPGIKRPLDGAKEGAAPKKPFVEAPKLAGFKGKGKAEDKATPKVAPKAEAKADPKGKAEAKKEPKAEPKKPEPKPKPEPPKPPAQTDIDTALKDAAQKVKDAEAALTVCQDAEMPYLRGIEVLPKDESDKVLGECDEGIKKALPLMQPTVAFIKTKTAEYRKFTADSTKKAIEDLAVLEKKIEKIVSKFNVFKKETEDRKVTAVIAEVSESVVAAENKVKAVSDITAPFADAEKVKDMSVADLKESSEKAAELEKEASTACTEARKVVGAVKPPGNSGNQVKAAVQKLQTRLNTAQQEIQKQKKLIGESTETIINKECDAEKMMAEVNPLVEKVEEAIKKLEEAVEPLKGKTNEELEAFATPLTVRETAESLMAEVTKIVDEAKSAIKDNQSKLQKVTKGPLLETKKDLGKILVKVESSGRKSGASVKVVHTACTSLAQIRYQAACTALRAEVQKKGITPDDMFKKVAKKGNYVKPEAVIKLLDSIEDLKFPDEHKKLLCKHLGIGEIHKRVFDRMVKQFLVVVKGTAITSDFDVNKSKTLRKAEVNEVFEVLEGPRTDEELGLQRVRAKSLVDNLEGWVAVKGNKGTPFLEDCDKPFYLMTKETPLEKDFESGEALRNLKPEEIFEVVQGPMVHKVENAARCKGKVIPDGKTGWFTVKDVNGTAIAETTTKIYSCKAAVAITDDVDIKKCKVVRRLAEGELLEMTEGPEDADGITRIKVKAVKDGESGWITTTGNAGTVYAEPSTLKLWVLNKDTLLEEKFTGDVNKTVESLKAGTIIEVSEGPKEEKSQPITKFKGLILSDGTTGWIPQKHANMRPWKSTYKCIKAIEITKEKASGEVRKLDVGETVEFLEGPAAGDEKEMKMKGRALKDGATGWVTIMDKAGVSYLRSG